jgi:SAM-dependent methyltransferase
VPAYDALASVYEWLVPDELLEPEGAIAAFAPVVAELPAGGRVLDCAAGTGQLAVGLALRGFDVTATDASGGMVARARALAAARGAELGIERCVHPRGARRRPPRRRAHSGHEHVQRRRRPLPGHGPAGCWRRRTWRMTSIVSVMESAMPRPSASPFHGLSSNASPPM